MNAILKTQVLEIAEKIHNAVAKELGDFFSTTKDEHGIAVADLNGYCAICSGKLWEALNVVGINSKLVVSDDGDSAHVFLVLQDYVLDVTATQFKEFKKRRVVLLHECEAEAFWFYKPCASFDTLARLRKYQIKNNWPLEQIA